MSATWISPGGDATWISPAGEAWPLGEGWLAAGCITDDGVTAPVAPADEPTRRLVTARERTVIGFDGGGDFPGAMVVATVDSFGTVTIERADEEPGDILAQIDAAITQHTDVQLCACGCRIAIRPSSPSPFFASQACQRRWAGQQATEPAEVYARPDAARVYADDAARVPLVGEDLDDELPAFARGGHIDPDAPPPCADPYGTAYRRRCPGCAHWDVPLVARVEVIHLAADGPGRIISVHRCPNCHTDFHGPAYIATVEPEGNGWLLLELRDSESRVQRMLSIRQLGNENARQGLIRKAWASMEDQLERFARGWAGTPLRTRQGAR